MVALDLETSGLNPQLDDIISLGWAHLEGRRIPFSSCREELVRPRNALPPETVIIHGISDDRAATGLPLREALPYLLMAMAGRVVVGHHIRMDLAFLAKACTALDWGRIVFPYVDTLALAQAAAQRRQTPLTAGALTLETLRESSYLPRYPAHNALWDAISAGELWLALSAEMAGTASQLPLRRVVRIYP